MCIRDSCGTTSFSGRLSASIISRTIVAVSYTHLDVYKRQGFGLAGILLTKYCPDPILFESHEAWEAASVNAHYIWYYFAGIGLIAAIALLIFAKITQSIDKKKKA